MRMIDVEATEAIDVAWFSEGDKDAKEVVIKISINAEDSGDLCLKFGGMTLCVPSERIRGLFGERASKPLMLPARDLEFALKRAYFLCPEGRRIL